MDRHHFSLGHCSTLRDLTRWSLAGSCDQPAFAQRFVVNRLTVRGAVLLTALILAAFFK